MFSRKRTKVPGCRSWHRGCPRQLLAQDPKTVASPACGSASTPACVFGELWVQELVVGGRLGSGGTDRGKPLAGGDGHDGDDQDLIFVN
jgi:hypothetical protein